MNIFVTGGTGFVGSYLCAELLSNPDNNLYILSRNSKNETAKDRVVNTLSEIINLEDDTWKNRINIVNGDLENENLGIDKNTYLDLCEKINVIYHCAASIDFSLDYKEAYKINVLGTRAILDFMTNIKVEVFERLNYVSTAYIAGLSDKEWTEFDLNFNQGFANTYEKTKFETELMLQDYIKRKYPIIIHRPSIVNSSSKNGSTHKNNIIFKFIKLLYKERLHEFLCNDESSINLVPVDYFVESMIYLNESEENIGKTFHLVSPNNILVKDVIQTVTNYLEVKCPSFKPFDEKFSSDKKINYIFHYINHSHRFDDNYTQLHLEKAQIKCPPISKEYLELNLYNCKERKLLR